MKEFHSLSAFSEHILKTSIIEAVIIRKALAHAAEAVEKRAKAKIGDYQGQAGPFMAWAELADFTKEDRIKKGFTENDPLLRTGELRDSITHSMSVDGLEAQIGSNLDIAVYQELGTDHIPPRSFLGSSANELAPKIVEMIGVQVTAVLAGKGVIGGAMAIE
jgi:phage gpG-like protein